MGLIANLGVVLALAGPAVTPAPEPAPAPAPAAAPKAEILGVWKGTSICTKVEGNEFCHDETVVYNVVDVPDQPATVGMKAARVVDETVQPMYELAFTYRPEQGAWVCEFERPSFRGVWSYVIHDGEMTGTATVLPSMKVVRNVAAKRIPREQATAP